MGLPQLLAHWFVTDKITELAERIAARSRQAVWQRVWQRVGTLCPAEARGYIRARAAAIVHQETDRLIAQEGSRAGEMREKLLSAAVETLIVQLLDQSQRTRRMNAPSRRVA